jgi:hypothetical protein
MTPENSSSKTIISDPGERVAPELIDNTRSDCWQKLPYETMDGRRGVMLADGGGDGIPDAAVPLGTSGWHRISLGLFSGYYTRPEINLRLSGDDQFDTLSLTQTCRDNVYELGSHIYEVTWKTADLTGQNLVLAGNRNPHLLPTALAYVRLEPAEPLTQAATTPQPPLMVTSDGWGWPFGFAKHKAPEDIVKIFDPIPPDSKITGLFWGCGVGDWCNYPTKVGTLFSEPAGLSYQGACNFAVQNANIRLWRQNGWDSLRVVRDFTRDRGWELHTYIRMQGFGVLYPRSMQIRSDFFENHPEWHCRDRHGCRLSRISYAYPEVQDHMLALIRENAAYEPEGICLNFVRGLPLALYEPIMIDGFRSRFGVDPRTLPEDDERWLDYRAEIGTSFMRRVRGALVGGPRISVMVPGNQADLRTYAADVATWVRDGLVDDVVPVGTTYNHRDVHVDDPDSLTFDYFAQLPGRDAVRLMPMLYPWEKFRTDFAGWLKLYDSWARQGADTMVVWDVDHAGRYPKVKELENLAAYNAQHRFEYQAVPLRILNGVRVDRYHYFEGI